ncbi:MAG TPA: transposase [Acidobacteriota bacterium]|nr:transposase [Acidobacteriota bacterium]
MKRRFFNEPARAHFLTFSCFHRRQFLTNEFARMCLRDSLEFARERHGFALWAYVFMPEHVHLLLYPLRIDAVDAAFSRRQRDRGEP